MQIENSSLTEEGKEKKKRRLTSKDEKLICEYINQLYDDRKKRRKDKEKIWAEIDRQIRMEPCLRHKMDDKGNMDPAKQWMPEMELPLQAQALEVLTADARRLAFPDGNSYFIAHGEVTDEYLDKAERFPIIPSSSYELFTGSNGEQQKLNQDDVDLIVQTFMDWQHRQFDLRGSMDIINAQSFSKGMGLGRVRNVTSNIFVETKRGIVKRNMKMPVLFPADISCTYIEDRPYHLMNEGINFEPATVAAKPMLAQDLLRAAELGGDDPNSPAGGWIKRNMKNIEGDNDGCVTVLEFEGDLVVPRKTTESLYIPNTIATVVKCSGKSGDVKSSLIRIRFRETHNSTYIQFPYHRENLTDPYATSPLMKGMPIQSAAADALNRLLMAGALDTDPVIQYDRDDAALNGHGRLPIHPGSQLATLGEIKTLNIGDASTLLNVYGSLLNQYAEVTGITAGRLGGQTVSHTTAYAKDAELTRGTIRTVDYVQSTLHCGLTQWLNLSYEIGRNNIDKQTISAFSPKVKAFINIGKDVLPEKVFFEAIGSGAPNEQRNRDAALVQGVQSALQIETFKLNTGQGTPIDLDGLQKLLLKQFGMVDTDELYIERTGGTAQGIAGQAGVQGAAQANTAGNALPAALQGLASIQG